MSAFRAVARRELAGLLNTTVGWVVAALMLSLASLSFFYLRDFLTADVASLDGYFDVWPALFSFLLPALTMRAFAEERASGMSELMTVLPLPSGTLVAGKFASLVLFVVFICVLSLPVPLGVWLLGELSITLVAAQYLSLILLAAAMIAIGLFVSALVQSPAVAYVSSVVVLIVLSFLGSVPALLGLGGNAARLARGLSLEGRYGTLAVGLVDITDIAYFAVIVAICMRAAAHAVYARRY